MTFPHLNGRAEKLAEELDLAPDVAEWIALVALHSGCFLRTQYPCYSNDTKAMTRFTQALVKQKLVVEIPGDDGLGLLCRITNKRIYRVLGIANVRHRRQDSWAYMCHRLLSLDYVLDHPGLPWLPTEDEKLACFEKLGVARADLPYREYGGAANVGRTRRYFANKHPIAVDSDEKSAVFVYADSDERSPKGLHGWRKEHAPLWSRLHEQGFRLRVVHAGRNPELARKVRNVFQGWSRDAASEEEISRMQRELGRLEAALENRDDHVLDEYGGFSRALSYAGKLEGRLDQKIEVAGYRAAYDVWLSQRIHPPGSWHNVLGPRLEAAQSSGGKP